MLLTSVQLSFLQQIRASEISLCNKPLLDSGEVKGNVERACTIQSGDLLNNYHGLAPVV